jgi:hypothetical protein
MSASGTVSASNLSTSTMTASGDVTINGNLTMTNPGFGATFDELQVINFYITNGAGLYFINGAQNNNWGTSNSSPVGTNCNVGDLRTNYAATSASTVLYVCYPTNTWNAVTIP